MLNLTIISIFILSIISAISTSSIPLTGLRQELAESIKEIQLYGEPKEFDSSLRDLLAQLESFQMAAPRTLQLDWEAAELTTSTEKKSVCIVVSSFEGMYINSGIGTAYYALATFLVAHGHTVTVVYTRSDDELSGSSWDHWVAFYQNKGITLLSLPPTTTPLFMPALQAVSLRVYRYLATTSTAFDIVHFADFEGHGFYPTLAKKVSNQFADTAFVVGLHGPTRWVLESNFARIPTDETEVDIDWMERMSIENADAVWTPSAYMASWMTVQGWTLPASIHLLPLAPGPEFQDIISKSVNVQATEFVYFGRMEVRKGLVLFCDALDLFAKIYHTFDKEITITFLGRSAQVNGVEATEYVAHRAAKWPFKISMMSNTNRKESLDYLMDSSASRVAIIPSLSDNAPYTVMECLYAGVPFLASSISSVAPLFADDTDRSAHLFEVKPHHIVSKMAGAIRNGLKSAIPSFSVSQAESVWTSFYNKVNPKEPVVVTQDVPLVTVVITHHNRPELLKQAIASVEAQTYSEIEVVLVDDGSTEQSALNYLKSIESSFQAKNWKIIRGQNKYLGAARNAGAKAAKGKYLLFLDDDNTFLPTAVAAYVQAAKQSGAAIVTSGHAVFEGVQPPTEDHVVRVWVPLGASLAAGLFKNTFGDANFFVEKAKFVLVGGFTEEKNVGLEEHEFFAKSVFNGTKLEVIPEVLLYYRQHSEENQMLYTTDMRLGEARRLRPYLAALGSADNTKQNDNTKQQNSRRSLVNLVARNAVSPRSALCNVTLNQAVTPSAGIYPGGYPITISGSGFTNCGGNPSSVTIDGNTCSIIGFTDSQITCTVPQGNSVYTAVDVVVTVGGTAYKIAKAFTYNPTPAPALASAVLDNTATVTVTFTVPTNKGGASKRSVVSSETAAICQQLLDDLTFSKIGKYPDCVWVSDSAFTIALSNDATLSNGDNVTIPAGVLRGAGPYGAKNLYSTAPVYVSGSFPPTASISTSTQVGVCQGIVLDATGSTGSYGREFVKIQWTLVSSIKAPASSVNAITTALSAASSARSLTVTLSATQVVAGAQYTFQLQVTNWYALSDTVTVKVEKSTAAVPMVAITGASVRSIYKETPVTLSGSYAGLACSNSTTNADGEAVFTWTVSPDIGPFTGSAMQVLTIPAGTLSAAVTYTITFTVSDIDSGASNSASITVIVVPHAISAILLGGGTQFGLNSTVTLDASQSTDPELLAPLSFQWGCYSSNSLCNYAFSTDPVQTFKGSDIGVGTFTITVTVSGAANRSAVATTTIVVTQLPFLKIHIMSPYTTYARSQTITLTGVIDATDASASDITFAWSTTGTTTSSIPYPNGVTSRILVIAPNSLQTGSIYTYTLSATHVPTGVTGSATITFNIISIAASNNTICAKPNASPAGSYIFSFGDIWQYAAGVNTFQVFYSFPPSTIQYPLTAPSTQYQETEVLPTGKLQINGYGSSSTGVTTTLSCTATVAAAKLATIRVNSLNASDFYSLAVDTFSLYNSKTVSNDDFTGARVNILTRALYLVTAGTFTADDALLSTTIVSVIANPKNGQLGINEITSLGQLSFNLLGLIGNAGAAGTLTNAQVLSVLGSLLDSSSYATKQLVKASSGVPRARHVQDASPYSELIAAASAAQAASDGPSNPWVGATTASEAAAAGAIQATLVRKMIIIYLPIGPTVMTSEDNIKNFYKDTPSSIDSSGLQVGTDSVLTIAAGFVPTSLLGGDFVAFYYEEDFESDIPLPVNFTFASNIFNLYGFNATADTYNMSTPVTVLVPQGSINSSDTSNSTVNSCYMYTNGNWTSAGVKQSQTEKNDTLCTYPQVATFAVLNHAAVLPVSTSSSNTGNIIAPATGGNSPVKDDGGGLSGGAIAGIVIGCVAAAAIIVGGAYAAKRRHDNNAIVTGRPSPRYGDSGVGGVAIDPPLDPIFVPAHMGPMYVPPAAGSAGPVYLNRSALVGQPGDAASPVIYGTFQQPPIAAVVPAAAAAGAPAARRANDNDDFSSDSDSESRSRSGSVSSASSASSRSSRYSNRHSDDDTMEGEIRGIAGELSNHMPRNQRDRDELSDQMDSE